MRVRTPVRLQNEPAECGATSLQIILAYHGRFVDTNELRTVCDVSRDGVRGDHLVNAARSYGMQVHSFRKAPASLSTLKPPFIAFMAFNHYVVIEGFSGGMVDINDPARGRHRVTQADFERLFTGIVFTFELTPKFRRQGRPRSLLARITSYTRVTSGTMVLIAAAAALSILPILTQPALLQSFINHVLAQSAALFPPLLLVTLIVLGLSTGFALLLQSLMRHLENQLMALHSGKLMWRFLHLPDAYFTRRSAGDLGTRFDLVDSLSTFLAGDGVRFVLNGLLLSAYLLLLTAYHPALPMLSGGLLAVYALVAALQDRRMRESAAVWQGKLGQLTGMAVNGLQHIEHVKANGAEADVFARLAASYSSVQSAAISLSLAFRGLRMSMLAITGLNTVLIFLFGMAQVQRGLWSISAFAAVYIISLGLWNAAAGLTGVSARLARAGAEINRLDDTLQQPAHDRLPPPAADSSGIEVTALTFGYKRLNTPLLDQINLSIPPGSSIGLVGASGSGKTTLVRLLAGLYEPQSGTLRRGRTALIDDDSVLFEGTVGENITLWDDAVSFETMVRAAQDAEIDADIRLLPQQYHTPLGEQGRTLSGGQRQRLRIARALTSEPDVLILDEATSALDPVLEAKVLANIRRRGCTLLVVSHRWSAIQACEEIWVMEHGRIVARGTHETLWQANPTYRQLMHVAPLPDRTKYIPSESAPRPAAAAATLRARWTAMQTLEALVAHPNEALWDGLTTDDAATAACTILGREIGFAVQRPLTDCEDAILAIAAASHVYARRVRLPVDWWRQDNGPFIALRHGRPVAVVRRKQRYYAVDVAARQMIPFDRDNAAGIDEMIYQFYPSLLNERVTTPAFIRYVARHIPADWRVLALCGGLVALLQLIPAFLMGIVFDIVLPYGHLSLVGQIILALLATTGLMALFTFVQETAVIRIQARTDFAMQSALWSRLLTLSPAFFRQFSAGDLVMRVIGSRDTLQTMILTLVNSVFYSLSLVVALIALLLISPLLAGTGLLLSAIYMVLLLWIGQRFFRAESAAVDQRGRNSGWVTTILQGVSHLHAAGAVERAFRVWADRFALAHRAAQHSRRAEGRVQVLNDVGPLIALLALFLAVMASNGLMSSGTFIAAQIIFLYAASAAFNLGTSWLALLRLAASYRRIVPILEALPETRPGQPPAHPLKGEILLDDVTFRYNSSRQPALQNVSLHILANEFVAIVGASGSGKSTLLRLLLGFEHPDSGTVAYDGQALSSVDVRSVRSQIGTVLQQMPLFFGASIFDNLAGARQITQDDAWAALRFAGLDAEVASLPMGLHTPLTEGGKSLSAGQRQRLLIARAVVHQPRILFFDEATSALDDQTQALLIRHLSSTHVTRIVIAHRLSTVQQADRIVVLDQGRVMETGTYDALMARNGLFAEFARRQLLE